MSEFFALPEFLHSDTALAMAIENLPSWQHVESLKRLAATMDAVRSLLGDAPITISSGYRCPELNAAVGGVSDSAHLYGLACDFACPSFGTTSSVCRALEPHLAALGIDQLIDESPPDGWLHLAIAADGCIPRNECFSA